VEGIKIKYVANMKIGADKKIQSLCLPHFDGNLSIRTPITGSVRMSMNLPRKKTIPTRDRPIPRSSA
jgi:hypothetical protein